MQGRRVERVEGGWEPSLLRHIFTQNASETLQRKRERQPSRRYVEEMPLILFSLPLFTIPSLSALTQCSRFIVIPLLETILILHTHILTHTDMHTAFTVYPDSDPEIWASRRHKLYRSFSSPIQTHPQLFQSRVKTKHGRSHKHTAVRPQDALKKTISTFCLRNQRITFAWIVWWQFYTRVNPSNILHSLKG